MIMRTDFFLEGKRDAISEVRILRSCGQWTSEKRTQWTKEAVAIHHRLKHTHPATPQGVAYYAGRVSALRSRCTAGFSDAAQPLSQGSWAWCGDEDNEGITHTTVHPGGFCPLCCLPDPAERRSLACLTRSDLERVFDLLCAVVLCLVILPFVLCITAVHAMGLLIAFLKKNDDPDLFKADVRALFPGQFLRRVETVITKRWEGPV